MAEFFLKWGFCKGNVQSFTFAASKFVFGGVAELVECTGLENRRTRKGTGGSNPSSSALYKTHSVHEWVLCFMGHSLRSLLQYYFCAEPQSCHRETLERRFKEALSPGSDWFKLGNCAVCNVHLYILSLPLDVFYLLLPFN